MSRFVHVTLILATVLFGVCLGVRKGSCPKVKPITFDPNDLGGTWYEVAKVDNSAKNKRVCSTAEFTFTKNNKNEWSFQMNSTSYVEGTHFESMIIEPRPASANLKGEFMVGPSLITSPNFFLIYSEPNFALTFLCQPVSPFFKSDKAWIMSREQHVSPEDLFRLEKKLRSLQVDLKMTKVNQKHSACYDGEVSTIDDAKSSGSEQQDDPESETQQESGLKWDFALLDEIEV
ncbi:apolipoprotein D-like [Symsagittifera roscoffensis]|uniref:apolipoprotein D-like n=1 Tax=Symsagittifera roscoffensis TaxID=84072 RepID=UPI00307C4A72